MMRILIVEDEEHLARLVAEVLGREGPTAETASDGRTALARALSEDFLRHGARGSVLRPRLLPTRRAARTG